MSGLKAGGSTWNIHHIYGGRFAAWLYHVLTTTPCLLSTGLFHQGNAELFSTWRRLKREVAQNKAAVLEAL